MITLLGGGIGASRLARALAAALPPEELVLVVNTADDLWHYGLRVCPDLDTNLYALSGHQNRERGWGLAGDTFRCMDQVRSLGQEAWFNLGDLDLATHLLRTGWLRYGQRLADVTQRLAEAMGVRVRVIPMSEDEVETHVLTPDGWLHYQEFLVRRAARAPVVQVAYRGLETARPAGGLLDAIRDADVVILGPSNPVASILPILALPGVRAALAERTAPVVAVTPVVNGIPIADSGEARRALCRAVLLSTMGLSHTATAVASLYCGLADRFVLDTADAGEALAIARMGLAVTVAPTILSTSEVGGELVDRILGDSRGLAKHT